MQQQQTCCRLSYTRFDYFSLPVSFHHVYIGWRRKWRLDASSSSPSTWIYSLKEAQCTRVALMLHWGVDDDHNDVKERIKDFPKENLLRCGEAYVGFRNKLSSSFFQEKKRWAHKRYLTLRGGTFHRIKCRINSKFMGNRWNECDSDIFSFSLFFVPRQNELWLGGMWTV